LPCLVVFSFIGFPSHTFILQSLMQKFLSLGAECVGFQEAAQASRGTLLCCSFCLSHVPFRGLLFLFLFCTVDALTAANACIASLEAELDASRKAWDIGTATKVAAEKTAKSAETKAKKAEKALADADQRRVQREQTIAKRLDKISAFVGGKYRVVPILSTCSCFYLLIFAHFLFSLSSVFQRRKLECLWSLYNQILKIL
jgi:hypothetical protein